jgi:hypothetical protein
VTPLDPLCLHPCLSVVIECGYYSLFAYRVMGFLSLF